ncbi:putative adenylyltransferase/sulfurtransferase MoeZ [Botrimarina colliarenosi]|uniref:Putative adenylyltransferase/sulfurtransferase MoeZ n=1 Tax=Botrimarina colliarenosi TaxID=2528001 RepID=A0A5C6A7U1_9BACT|nr:rhodanese-like domain-containing protein [Botrimarina colliarenosi]TWT96004.1 putative adenylyltransferase/sulfurtransferase MoeZ [Botrimarina colliarenosi]
MNELPLEVSCAELKGRLDDGVELMLVDCREPFEHEVVRLPDACLMPMGTIPSRVAELAAVEGPLVVYCHHGMRSAQTAAWLRENGVPQAQSLAGGVDAWATEIDPTLPRY